MNKPAGGPGADVSGGVRGTVRAYAPYALLIGAVWLGWQILSAPVMERGPVDIAIRLAPNSPMVLRRAAESELAAKQFDDAEDLARRALRAAPFDIRALSVVGMTMAERDRDAANEVITLAGNWSLRDDPTHAWLTYERLRRGDYASAFAHADTLARRRDDVRPEIFKLFTTAAAADPRAIAPLMGLVAAAPPWREAFLDSLYANPEGDALLGALAVGLQRTPGPLDNRELGRLYTHWVAEGRIAAIQAVRQGTGRPSADKLVVDGDFSHRDAHPPFAWTLSQSANFTSAVMNDDQREGEQALRIDYDGFGSGERVAGQFLLLPPGDYILSLDARVEGDSTGAGLRWRLECITSAQLASIKPDLASGDRVWRRFGAGFSIGADCPAQRLVLDTLPGERRTARVAIWFDRVRIENAPR